MRAGLYVLAPVLVLLVAVVVWALVLPACSTAPWLGRFIPANCPVPPSAASLAATAEAARAKALRAEIQDLERELATRAACDTAPVIGVGDPLDLDRWNARDVGLLEGCWLFDSDLVRIEPQTGAISTADTWRVCFDAAGVGQQTITFSAGAECQGTMNAAFRDDGGLSLAEDSAVTCDPVPSLPVKSGVCAIDVYGRAACELSDGASAVSITLRRAE